MAVVINGTTGIDKVQDGSIGTADIAADAVNSTKIDNSIPLGRRNILRNGDMRIAQENAGTAITATSTQYVIDRIKHNLAGSTGARYSVQRKNTAGGGPDRHPYYMRVECTTAQSAQSGTQSNFEDHRIESQDLNGLAWGTTGAKGATLSFWIKGNVTGTYAVWFYSVASVANKMITKYYTINNADTWEYKTITIPARNDEVMASSAASGLYVRFIWNTGTGYSSGTASTSAWAADSNVNRYAGHGVNLASATGNYIETTGHQLEAGSVATEFEFRDRGTQLRDCQRYFYKWVNTGLDDQISLGTPYNPAQQDGSLPNTSASGHLYFPTEMRARPTVVAAMSAGSINRASSTYTGFTAQMSSTTVSQSVSSVTSYTATAEL